MTSQQPKVVLGSMKNKIVASDLQEERAKCAFDQKEMELMLKGSPEQKRIFDDVIEMMKKHPEMANHHKFYELDPEEKRIDLWKRNIFIDQNYPQLFRDAEMGKYPYFFINDFMQGLMPGVGLNYSMFQMTLQNVANEEQKAKWIPMQKNHRILGCYAQTEIGHGSNVAGMLTTATLDKSTDEFVIHTPCVEATKFWPGDLGRCCTHAAVFARCLVDGNDFGVHSFLVPIRDPETFKHVAGVESGDMGPKLGYTSKDNGWATFNKVRIPRTNMLMGLANLDKEGNFTMVGDPRVLYSIMMTIRLKIIANSCFYQLIGLQLALRYNTVRRQFKTYQGNKLERKIIDYQTQQHSLTPILAFTYNSNLVGHFMKDLFRDMQKGLENKDYKLMDVSHHLLAGFKGMYSENMINNLDIVRRSCGGAGFHNFSGFTELVQNASPLPTFEGDNTVMNLQASRFIFKLAKRAQAKEKLPFPFEYISDMQRIRKIKKMGYDTSELQDIDILLDAMRLRAGTLIQETFVKVMSSKEPAKVKDNELFAQDKLVMVKAHFEYLSLHITHHKIKTLKFKDTRIRPILLDLLRVNALTDLIKGGSICFAQGYFAPEAYSIMQEALDIIIKRLRPQLIPLAEAFYVPDEVWPSSIGNTYGDIYETQLEWAKESRLNKLDEAAGGRPAYFEQYIKPFLKSDYSKAKL